MSFNHLLLALTFQLPFIQLGKSLGHVLYLPLRLFEINELEKDKELPKIDLVEFVERIVAFSCEEVQFSLESRRLSLEAATRLFPRDLRATRLKI